MSKSNQIALDVVVTIIQAKLLSISVAFLITSAQGTLDLSRLALKALLATGSSMTRSLYNNKYKVIALLTLMTFFFRYAIARQLDAKSGTHEKYSQDLAAFEQAFTAYVQQASVAGAKAASEAASKFAIEGPKLAKEASSLAADTASEGVRLISVGAKAVAQELLKTEVGTY